MDRKSNSSKWLFYISILAVALAVASCDRKTIYHHYEHTPLSGWEKDDTLFFSMKPITQAAVLHRDIELRTDDSYPFRSLNLIVEQTTFPSRLIRRDTLDCQLVTPDGTMLGRGITLYQYRFRLPDVSLTEGDSLSLSIHHNMRRETLPGIADVGIRMMAAD